MKLGELIRGASITVIATAVLNVRADNSVESTDQKDPATIETVAAQFEGPVDGSSSCALDESLQPELSRDTGPGGPTTIGCKSAGRGENLATDPGCDELYRMKDLGWNGGDKDKWCKSKGYDGAISHQASPYSRGSFCYTGDEWGCFTVASLHMKHRRGNIEP